MTTINTLIRVGPHRIVTLHYVMRNAAQEVLVDTREQGPARFLFGSGEILPHLESQLAGLKIGEQRTFRLSPETTPGLDHVFHFDVTVDDIRWAVEPETPHTKGLIAGEDDVCGPACSC